MTKMTNSNKYFIKDYIKSLSFCLRYLTHNISDDDDIHDDDKGDKQQQVFYQKLHEVIVFLCLPYLKHNISDDDDIHDDKHNKLWYTLWLYQISQ